MGKGAVPDKQDWRDFDYERISEALGAPQIDWDKGYEVLESVGIKVEDQNGSGSCVGQSWSKYAEVLERVENKNFTDLSAKFIYSQIFLPSGGAYLREGAKLVVNQGVAHEDHLESYPSTEENMTRLGDITDEMRNHASVYKSKSYASIWHKNNIDIFAQAILENHGCVTGAYGTNAGWGKGFVEPPTEEEGRNNAWGHAFYCIGFNQIQGKKYIKFINSWGNGWGEMGYGYLSEDYFTSGNIFSAWTLVDLPNPVGEIDMLKLIKESETASEVFVVSGGKRFWVMEPDTLNAGIGSVWDGWSNVAIEDPKQYEYGGSMIIVRPDDPIK